MANYPSVLHYEMLHDPQTAAAAIEEHIKRPYEGYVQAYGDGIVGGRTGDYTSASYHPLVYAKAPCSSTRCAEKGDEAFFRGLQSYYVDCKYRVATPKSLLADMEKSHGQLLGECS